MNRYVVDASALIQAFVLEPDTARVQTLFAGLEGSDPDEIHVPEFCLLECANILWKHVRLHNMPTTTARQALEAIQTLPFAIHPVLDLLSPALEIGLAHQLAIYDSLYIALAESLGYPLITADQRQAQAAQAVGITVKPLADFPAFQA